MSITNERDADGAERPGPFRDKYRQILNAAIEVIAENGFANSRVSQIAQKAGVADGTIYLYFKSKDQILLTALDQAFGTFVSRAKKEIAGRRDPVDKLKAIIRLHLAAMAENPPLAVVLQTELRQSAKFLAEISQRQLRSYLQLLRDVIKEGQQLGLFRPEISERLAVSCLFGAMDDVVTAWILNEKHYELLSMTEGISDLLLHGLVKSAE